MTGKLFVPRIMHILLLYYVSISKRQLNKNT
ncbi:UNVERIFIED_CONTAM: hypothetical protein GTU68_035428 [Idotea baltica]|nr:hypothetical protein [Idotea baltica]